MSESLLVSAFVRNPNDSLFKSPKNDKAECICVHCSCPQGKCGLQARGECSILGGIMLSKVCPYGRLTREQGFTTRAQKFSSWIADRKKQHENTPSLNHATVKLAVVGDYMFLPYAHMPESFVRLANWNSSVAVCLLERRPKDFFGGVIQRYQAEIVPLFASHLREECPEIWREVIAMRPAFDTEPDHVGRKALVRTLKPGIQWRVAGRYASKYPVEWTWDGTNLSTTSRHVYNDVWGGIGRGRDDNIHIRMTPSEDATVVVQDNAWVTDDTVFVD